MFLAFAVIRGVVDDTAIPEHVAYPVVVEGWIPGQLPSTWVQARFMTAQVSWFDIAVAATYFSYFIVPHVVVLIALRRSQGRFLNVAGPIVLALYAGTFVALVLPTVPPWLAAERGEIAPVERRIGTLSERISGETARQQDEVASANEVAAMPSLHLAIPAVLALVAVSRTLRALGWLYVAAMGVSLVYLGEHYVVDLAGGAALAYAAVRMWGWLRVRVAKDLLPDERAAVVAGTEPNQLRSPH
jgi:membrane-associated phospholipid phosphatase